MSKLEIIMNNIINNIRKKSDIKTVHNAFWESFYHKTPMSHSNIGKNVKILLLCISCGGKGDIIFCIKVANFLREWYNAQVYIGSTDIDSFKQLGETKNLIKLNAKIKEFCRRFKSLTSIEDLTSFDLYFVTPVQSNFNAKLQDITSLVHVANKFNTFFFSEYNHYDDENFDFPMGVGGDKYGLLITKPTYRPTRHPTLTNPYVFLYIADIDDAEKCFMSFLEMICAKYYKIHKKLDVIIPKDVEFLLEDFLSKILKIITKYYTRVLIVYKDETNTLVDGDSSKTLSFRADIFPQPYSEMFGLMKHSLKDILVTGDQSITDVLSCCSDKNIWYQIGGWKETFAQELSYHLPHKYIASTKTSCGTLKGIKYKSDYKKFVKNWNFTYLAKPKLDAIIQMSIFKQENRDIVNSLEEIVNKSRNMNTLLEKLEKIK